MKFKTQQRLIFRTIEEELVAIEKQADQDNEQRRQKAKLEKEEKLINSEETQNVLRRKRAYSMINCGKTPVMISDNEFVVPSQSNSEKEYKVLNIGSWTCECQDFKKRGLPCKHILGIQIWLKINDSFDAEKITLDYENCPKCHSFNLKKHGMRKNKNGDKQRWRCLDCGKTFVLEQLKYVKADGRKIAICMDLYFKGCSLRGFV